MWESSLTLCGGHLCENCCPPAISRILPAKERDKDRARERERERERVWLCRRQWFETVLRWRSLERVEFFTCEWFLLVLPKGCWPRRGVAGAYHRTSGALHHRGEAGLKANRSFVKWWIPFKLVLQWARSETKHSGGPGVASLVCRHPADFKMRHFE